MMSVSHWWFFYCKLLSCMQVHHSQSEEGQSTLAVSHDLLDMSFFLFILSLSNHRITLCTLLKQNVGYLSVGLYNGLLKSFCSQFFFLFFLTREIWRLLQILNLILSLETSLWAILENDISHSLLRCFFN